MTVFASHAPPANRFLDPVDQILGMVSWPHCPVLRRIHPVFVGLLAFGAAVISVGMAIDSNEYWLIVDYPAISIFAASAIFLLMFRQKVTGRALEAAPDFRHEFCLSGPFWWQNSCLNFQSPSCYQKTPCSQEVCRHDLLGI